MHCRLKSLSKIYKFQLERTNVPNDQMIKVSMYHTLPCVILSGRMWWQDFNFLYIINDTFSKPFHYSYPFIVHNSLSLSLSRSPPIYLPHFSFILKTLICSFSYLSSLSLSLSLSLIFNFSYSIALLQSF